MIFGEILSRVENLSIPAALYFPFISLTAYGSRPGQLLGWPAPLGLPWRASKAMT
jgi:hypothetical protein